MRKIFSTIKNIFPAIAGIMIAGTALAQQEAMFTQYMHNEVTINPAYAGSHEALSATALFRKQWVGMTGSPTTGTFNIHTPLKNERVGVGLSFISDKIGVSSNNNIYGSYAYILPLDRENKHNIHFGLQGGFTYSRTNYNELTVRDGGDSRFDEVEASGFLPNIGAGAYYYSDWFYFGFSIPQFVNNALKANDQTISQQERHYFVSTGFVFDISPRWKGKPSMFAKFVPGAPSEIDVTGNVILDDTYWFGLAYRSFDSIDLLLAMQITEQLKAGYAYDYSLTTLQGHNTGSHEIMINWRMAVKEGKVLTPRYF